MGNNESYQNEIELDKLTPGYYFVDDTSANSPELADSEIREKALELTMLRRYGNGK